MNILQVGSYLYPDLVGGAEISANNMRGILTHAGHRVVMMRSAARGPSFRTRLTPDGEDQWAAASWRPFRPIERGTGPAKAAFYAMEFASHIDRGDLRALIAQERIDLVMVHSLRGIGYDLVTALADIGVPVALFLHDLALVCMNKSMVRHGTLCRTSCGQCRIVQSVSRRAIERMGDRVVLVGPSAQIVDRIRSLLAIPGLRGEHLPNPNRYSITPRQRTGGGPPTIGYVGRLSVEKGLPGLLDVADRLAARGMRLLVAGDGELADEVRSFAASRPWVDYRGFVDPSETAPVYEAIDILAMPSLWPENFPGAAVQALVAGSPVFAFAVGGIPEIVEDGVSGRLIAFGDFDALHDALAEVIDDPSRLARLSAGALEASRRYDADRLADRLLVLLGGLAHAHPASIPTG